VIPVNYEYKRQLKSDQSINENKLELNLKFSNPNHLNNDEVKISFI